LRRLRSERSSARTFESSFMEEILTGFESF
jgi:hypothetical protein